MKTPSSSTKSRAFVANSMVFSIAMVLVSGLAFAFQQHIRSLENQGKSQVKIDYTQKEDALLRALLHIVPNKAIGAMQDGSNVTPSNFTWETIFNEAIQLANAETAVDANLIGQLGTGSNPVISGNTGDGTLGAVSTFVAPLTGTGSLVNPGDTRETALLVGSDASKLPAPLYSTSGTVYSRDRQYPIISRSKIHADGWTKGIQLSPTAYPQFNLYSYPNVRFGYARPGDAFVAKRNWWTFSIRFGGANSSAGVPTVLKKYLLSIYEVPSQLPMSSAGLMHVGKHEDGSDWSAATLSGGIFADRLQTEGTVSVSNGLFSARRSLAFSGSTSVDGTALGNDFDALGVRESREAQAASNFHQASVAGNVGKVAFIPLNTGASFLSLINDGTSSGRLSNTGWHNYTNGGNQAKMRVMFRTMQSINDQIPTEFRFYYINTSGSRVFVTYTRGNNWPTINETGGATFPFQTAVLDNGKRVFVVHLDRIPALLASISGAAAPTVNNSLYIYPDTTRSTVKAPNIPSVPADLAVSLRSGADLSAFTNGFSLVTNLRTYVSETLNNVPITAPTGAGLPAGELYYPPISLFAPEKRFGDSVTFNHPINFNGQVNSLKVSDTDAFRPLDLVSGGDETVHAEKIQANLRMLKSPAQLPPIYLMNWLVTLEEIHQGQAN